MSKKPHNPEVALRKLADKIEGYVQELRMAANVIAILDAEDRFLDELNETKNWAKQYIKHYKDKE